MKEYNKMSEEEIKQLAMMRQISWIGKYDLCSKINNYMIILKAVNPDLTEDECIKLAFEYDNVKSSFKD